MIVFIPVLMMQDNQGVKKEKEKTWKFHLSCVLHLVHCATLPPLEEYFDFPTFLEMILAAKQFWFKNPNLVKKFFKVVNLLILHLLIQKVCVFCRSRDIYRGHLLCSERA